MEALLNRDIYLPTNGENSFFRFADPYREPRVKITLHSIKSVGCNKELERTNFWRFIENYERAGRRDRYGLVKVKGKETRDVRFA